LLLLADLVEVDSLTIAEGSLPPGKFIESVLFLRKGWVRCF
jgi:hypothetical protein